MTARETINTPRQMIEAIAAGPTELFNQLIKAVDMPNSHNQHIEYHRAFQRHGFEVWDRVLLFLQGGQFKETFVPRPGPVRPKRINETSSKPKRTPAHASVLFFEAARKGKGQRFEAVVREGAEGVILPAQFYWQPRSDQSSDLLMGRNVVSHIAMLKASGKSSFTTAFGQLRQR